MATELPPSFGDELLDILQHIPAFEILSPALNIGARKVGVW
jgi:hypothetical protein